MEILIIWSIGILNLLTFYFGFKAGKEEEIVNEEIKMPNPIEIYKKHKENQEIKKEQERIDTIMQNINNYDGTSNRQKDIPS